MRPFLMLLFVSCASTSGSAQTRIAASTEGRQLTDTSSGMKIFGYPDGRYSFTYQNILSQKPDPYTVVFKDRAEAILFVQDIKKAFVSREGNISKVNYGNSQITLMPASNGSVFMRVETKGKNVSAFEINRLTFHQINILQ